MKLHDDPKLTAYALGELEGAAERAAIEALLREHPEAAAELEETRALAAMLRRELHAEDGAPLREEQRAEVLAMAQGSEPGGRSNARPVAWFRRPWVPAAMAACLAAALGMALLFPGLDVAKQSQSVRRADALATKHAGPSERSVEQGAVSPVPAQPAPDGVVSLNEPVAASRGDHADAPMPAPAPARPTLVAQGESTAAPTGISPAAKLLAEAKDAPREPAIPTPDADSTQLVLLKRTPTAPAAAAAPAADAARGRAMPADENLPFSASAAPTEPVAVTAPLASGAASSSPESEPLPKQERVKQLLVEAQGFRDTGRLDLAYKRAEQTLREDPYNIAARKLQDDVQRRKNDGAAEGKNHTRSAAAWQVEAAWDRPVRRFSVAETAVQSQAPQGTPAAAAAPQAAQSAFAGGGTLGADARAVGLADAWREKDFTLRVTPAPGQGIDFDQGIVAAPPADREYELRLVPQETELSAKSFGVQPPATDFRRKLETIVIPRLDLREVTLSEAIDFLKQKSVALDAAETDPARRGVNIVLQPDTPPAASAQAKPEEPRITVSLTNIPLGEALRYVAGLANLKTRVEAQAVLVGSGPAYDRPMEEAKKRAEEARRIIEQRRLQREAANTEAYDPVIDNAFLPAKGNPLSTFSIDVDTASYANVRRFLTGGVRPPKGAVRIEEMVNYFRYDYPAPQGDDPFSCTLEVAAAPWKPAHRLVRIGLKGRELAKEQRPASNLVFLLDVSGSMEPANKLPLVKECLKQLVNELGENDTVAIAVYAGASGTVLEPTREKQAMSDALERLSAGGSTNGAAGIRLAYELAQRSFKKGGNNRVILCTDGDFNVGVTSQSELVDLISEQAKSGVFLSVLGFGMGNLKDSTMEKLADKGNGNYAYIDSLKEGRKVLVEEMSGTLFTIAKDVKIQVEWNPAQVGAYRLIGYENRLLAKEDFNDDTKDAGEIGAGHTVTALYEVAPGGAPLPGPSVDPLRYESTSAASAEAAGESTAGAPAPGKAAAADVSKEMLWLKLRWKAPDGDTSTLRTFPLTDSGAGWERSTADFRWAAAVASFGMLLRDSPHKGSATWDSTLELAQEGKGRDPGEHRREFIELVQRAKELAPARGASAPGSTPARPPAAPQTKAATLMLPEFSVNDQPLLDAIDALAKKSRETDPEKSGVQVVYAGPSGGASARLTLRLHNVSVAEAARGIASAAGATLSEEGDTLILRAK